PATGCVRIEAASWIHSPQVKHGLLDREIEADLGGRGSVDRDAFNITVAGLDAIRTNLDAVLADRDGVAGEALVVGAAAAGLPVGVRMLDVGARIQRLAVGGDPDPDAAAGDFQAPGRGLAGFHDDVVDEVVRSADAIG